MTEEEYEQALKKALEKRQLLNLANPNLENNPEYRGYPADDPMVKSVPRPSFDMMGEPGVYNIHDELPEEPDYTPTPSSKNPKYESAWEAHLRNRIMRDRLLDKDWKELRKKGVNPKDYDHWFEGEEI